MANINAQVVQSGVVTDCFVVDGSAAVSNGGVALTWTGGSLTAAPGATFMIQADAGIGWTLADGVLVAPAPAPPPALTQAQLFAYASSKVLAVLATPRAYTVDGLSGPVIDDCGGVTALDMNSTKQYLSTLTYPFVWSDDNYSPWSMTQDQLTAFLGSAFAYSASVFAVLNGTAIPGINGGSITTEAQIDALAWPT